MGLNRQSQSLLLLCAICGFWNHLLENLGLLEIFGDSWKCFLLVQLLHEADSGIGCIMEAGMDGFEL